jgi:hypothetical protein
MIFLHPSAHHHTDNRTKDIMPNNSDPKKKRVPIPAQVDANQSISPEGTSFKATGDGDEELSGKEVIQYIMVIVTESDVLVHTVDEQLQITMGPGYSGKASIPADGDLSTAQIGSDTSSKEASKETS